MNTKRFALIGAAGFIAPQHMKAIKETGHELVAAIDPSDSVGVIDSYFPTARFFTEIERFDRHLEMLRRSGEGVDYVSICSPNYLHDAHVRLALRVHADAICEKPLVINPWNIDALKEIEREGNNRIHTIFQLRLLPELIELKRQIEAHPPTTPLDVTLTYVTRRGAWYHSSWKGSDEKSGGVAMNIGIHFFDLVSWIFGTCKASHLHIKEQSRMSGMLELEHARVRWLLSVDAAELPEHVTANGKHAYRSLTLDGKEITFPTNFTGLHTTMYREILEGRGPGLDCAYPSIRIVHDLRHARVQTSRDDMHPDAERNR